MVKPQILDICIHQRIEQQVINTPNAIALVFAEKTLTYRELNQRANQLSHYLVEQNVRTGSFVGLSVTHGFELPIAILAIIKAGAAFLPLDPVQPNERLQYMIDDSQIQIIITQTSLLSRFSYFSGQIVDFHKGSQFLNNYSKNNLSLTLSPTLPIYMMYTSGSTGKPKGVPNRHDSVMNALLWMQKNYHFNHDDCFLQKTSFAFDVSMLELISPLLIGARLILPQKNTAKNIDDLLTCFSYHQITVAFFSPSQLMLCLLNSDISRVMQSLRLICCLGEAMSPKLLTKYYASNIKAILYNAYGPTEAAIYVTSWQAHPNYQGKLLPIGKSISHTQLMILNDKLQPLANGIQGELYISGRAVASGYWQRPDLTAERFIEHPDYPQGKLYKTGDIAYFDENNNIVYVGRADTQIQLSGIRIELGEIENVLHNHPNVEQAVIILRTQQHHQYLAAYLVGTPCATDNIRRFLATQLAKPMIPSTFQWLQQLPLNINGKIDRHALVAMTFTNAIPPYDYPQTVIMKQLLKIWQDCLAINNIHSDDAFIDLGAHSLTAMRLLMQLKKHYPVTLSIGEILASDFTLKKLNKIIHMQQTTETTMNIIKTNSNTPASCLQQNFWTQEKIHTNSSAYTITSAHRITGDLNIFALTKAINHLFHRHQLLNSHFRIDDNGKLQLRCNPATKISLSPITIDNTNDYLSQLAKTQFRQQDQCLFSIKLIQEEHNQHVLTILFHHSIIDGISLEIFFTELSIAYTAYSNNNEPNLSPQKLQYSDFSNWHWQLLQTEKIKQQLDYWLETLAGATTLSLATDKSSKQTRTHRGDKLSIALTAITREQLSKFSLANSITPFMTLLGTFSILLNRYSRQDDIIIGTPIANRHYLGVENMVGLFVNSLALRFNLTTDLCINDYLLATKKIILDGFKNSDIPFAQVVKALKISRNQQSHPLFQVMFALEDMDDNALQLEGLHCEPLNMPIDHCKVDLALTVQYSNGQLYAEFEYASDLFSQATIKHLASYYLNLLTSMLNNSNTSIAKLSLLNNKQKTELLYDWHNKNHPYPHDQCIHQLISQQAKKSPLATALIYEDKTINYQQLDEQSNQCAHYLRQLGVDYETLVGLTVDRGFDMIIAIVAILKAGGAYVPLSPDLPTERLQFLLEDTQLAFVLSADKYAYLFNDIKIIKIESSKSLIAQQPISAINNINYPNNLAYVIYTSGSTGTPKGVMVDHQSICHLAFSGKCEMIGTNENSRVLQYVNYDFDAMVWDWSSALTHGATLCLLPQEKTLGDALVETINKYKITTATFPAGLFRLFNKQVMPTLESIIVMGDVCSIDALAYWTDKVKLFNGYGPTEAVVCTTMMRYTRGQAATVIGRPIGNKKVYVLDENLHPVAIGCEGELYIGGIGLARGYWNNAQLTEQCFIANPFASATEKQQGENLRLYKTGDIVKYLPSGDLQYITRLDTQVKVNGFRVELDEIASVIRQEQSVKDALVVAVNHYDEVQLHAYVISSGPSWETQRHALYTTIQQYLPSYMWPRYIVKIDKFPLNANGKIDEKQLAIPQTNDRCLTQSHYVAPTNKLQQLVATLWCEYLQLTIVGIHDDFISLGGDSLSAIRIANKLHAHGYTIGANTILHNASTIHQICLQIQTEQPNYSYPRITANSNNNAPLSHEQQRMWILNHLHENKTTYHVASVYKIIGTVNVRALQQAINYLFSRHDILCCKFTQHQQQINHEIDFSLSIHTINENNIQQTLDQFSQTPFILADGNLCRIRLWQLDNHNHYLHFLLHHIITDGWSHDIIIRELSHAYNAYHLEKTPNLIPPSLQYTDYAQWQHQWLQHHDAKQQLAYWQQQLHDAPAYLQLPNDHTRPTQPSYQGENYHLSLTTVFSQALVSFAQQQQITPAMLLLGAYAILLNRYSQQDDLIIGVPVANRHYPGVDQLIGLFVNTIPVRINITENEAITDFLLKSKIYF